MRFRRGCCYTVVGRQNHCWHDKPRAQHELAGLRNRATSASLWPARTRTRRRNSTLSIISPLLPCNHPLLYSPTTTTASKRVLLYGGAHFSHQSAAHAAIVDDFVLSPFLSIIVSLTIVLWRCVRTEVHDRRRVTVGRTAALGSHTHEECANSCAYDVPLAPLWRPWIRVDRRRIKLGRRVEQTHAHERGSNTCRGDQPISFNNISVFNCYYWYNFIFLANDLRTLSYYNPRDKRTILLNDA